MDEPEPTEIRYVEQKFRFRLSPELAEKVRPQLGAMEAWINERVEKMWAEMARQLYGAPGSVTVAMPPRGEDLTASMIVDLAAEMEAKYRDVPAAVLVSVHPLACGFTVGPDAGTLALEMMVGEGLAQEIRTLLDRYRRPVLVIDDRAWQQFRDLVPEGGTHPIQTYHGLPVHRIGHGDYLPKKEGDEEQPAEDRG